MKYLWRGNTNGTHNGPLHIAGTLEVGFLHRYLTVQQFIAKGQQKFWSPDLLKGSAVEYLALTFLYIAKIMPFLEAMEGVINTRQASAVYKTHIPPREAQNTVILPEEPPEFLKSGD